MTLKMQSTSTHVSLSALRQLEPVHGPPGRTSRSLDSMADIWSPSREAARSYAERDPGLSMDPKAEAGHQPLRARAMLLASQGPRLVADGRLTRYGRRKGSCYERNSKI